MEPQIPSGRTIYTGRKVELRVVDVQQPDGRRVERELVVHPGAVVVLARTAEGEVVMIRTWRFAIGAELWELPAGTLEPGEEPADCAARELAEETGFRAAVIEPLGTFYTTPGICTERIHAFTARELTRVGQSLDPGEQIRVECVSMERVRRMMLDGEIADAKTIAALGLYLLGSGGP